MLIFFFIILFANVASAALNVEVVNPSYLSRPIYAIDVRASEDGEVYALDIKDVFIREDNRITLPLNLSKPDEQGWQTLSYIPSHEVTSRTIPPSQTPVYIPIYTFIGKDEIFNYRAELPDLDKSLLTFLHKAKSEQVISVDFGNITEDRFIQVRINAQKTLPGKDKMSIESIEMSSEKMSYLWIGNTSHPQADDGPPVNIRQIPYDIRIRIKDPGTEAIFETMTITYDGGAKKTLYISANKHRVEDDPSIELLTPNGNEFLTPCQTFKVNWKGHNPKINSYLSVKYDEDSNWEDLSPVSSTLGDTLIWTVPEIITDSTKLRVNQKFNERTTKKIDISDNALMLEHTPNGKYLAVFFSLGSFGLYDVDTREPINEFVFGEKLTESTPHGMSFLSDSLAVVNYYVGSDSYFAIYNVFTSEKITDLEYDSKIMFSSYADIESGLVYAVQEYGRKIFVINPGITYGEGQIIEEITSQSAIMKFTLNGKLNQAVIASIPDQIDLLNLSSKKVVDSYNIESIPIINHLTISPNGEYIAVAATTDDNGASDNISGSLVFMIRTQTGKVFQMIKASDSDITGLSFNSTSTRMIIGSEHSPYLYMLDMVDGSKITFGAINGDKAVDVSFSPTRSSLAFSSFGSGFSGELKYAEFTYPQYDESDYAFSIVAPELEIDSLDFGEGLIFNTSTRTFSTEVENTGKVFYISDGHWFKEKVKNYKLINRPKPDTLFPGESARLEFEYTPKDIGALTDTLNLKSCYKNFSIPLTGVGVDRNIIFSDMLDFGERCVGDSSFVTNYIVENRDNVPLNLNRIAFGGKNNILFDVIDSPKDTILQPGEFVEISMSAVPDTLNDIFTELRAYHNDQEKYFGAGDAKIRGIGTWLDLSHLALPFINEEGNTRVIKIKNTSNALIKMNGASVYPTGNYEVLTPMPQEIEVGDSLEIEVRWMGGDSEAELLFEADPCPYQRSIPLAKYEALSVQSSGDVVAQSPIAEIEIPIYFKFIEENYPYVGDRRYESVIELNPRLFFPTDIRSSVGEAEFEDMGIENDKRRIKITVNGDYNSGDTLALLKGVAGAAETNRTFIDFKKSSYFMGSQVDIFQMGRGSVFVEGLSEDRIIIHGGAKAKFGSVSPNPASSFSNIVVNSEENRNVNLILVSPDGNLILKKKMNLKSGDNEINLDLSSVVSGSYELILENGKILDAKSLKVLK
jgi:hypothetical protein